MQTITLNVEDGFYNSFMELLKNISKDKIEIVDDRFPSDVIVNSKEEVRRRVYEAEQSEGLTEEEYNKEMDKFFQHELDIAR